MNAEMVMEWSKDARCRTANPDELFVQGAAQNRAKAVCMGCPVRTECLADALDNRVEFGVWGGMTERERRALLRRRPERRVVARPAGVGTPASTCSCRRRLTARPSRPA